MALSLTACAEANKQNIGAATGAVIGGVAGSTMGKGHGKTAAIIGGTMLGGLIGGSIGKSMDDVDHLKMQQALESSKTNQTVSWVNPDTHNSYAVTPTQTYTTNNTPCRKFTTVATIDGKQQTVEGTACRQNGKWVMKS
ncbi:MAG: hypothetical protein CMF50_08285 [Legionellales bacterium]|nr:hypothetical protein [Legionellales bacterium]